MKRALNLLLGLAVFGLLSLSTAFSSKAYGEATDKTIVSRSAEIDGVKLHYMTAGHGTPLILLHGYAETSRMWKPIIPVLAERFSVIAPDLPGIGDSDIPVDGLDMKSAAMRIHDLAKSLGVQKAEVVGHDIGLMVAYAYAAQFPTEVTKLVLMDAFLPGVEGWEAVYNNSNIWHFRFNGPTPEALVQGRERTYFDYFWNDFAADKTHSIPEADRKTYAAAYSRPGRMLMKEGMGDKNPNDPMVKKMCTENCAKMGGKYILYDAASKKVYQLDDQTKPQQFAGQNVKVTGTLSKDTIQVTNIEPGS